MGSELRPALRACPLSGRILLALLGVLACGCREKDEARALDLPPEASDLAGDAAAALLTGAQSPDPPDAGPRAPHQGTMGGCDAGVGSVFGYCSGTDETSSRRPLRAYGPPLSSAAVDTWRRDNAWIGDVTSGRAGDGVVILDVAESFRDADHSSRAERGQYDVEAIALRGGGAVVLSPARDGAERAAGVLALLPQHLNPPVRIAVSVVHERRSDASAIETLVLLVHGIERLSFPAPLVVPEVDLLPTLDPATWDRQYVTTTGSWDTGPEWSLIGPRVDLSLDSSCTQRCFPRGAARALEHGPVPVRVTGMAYTGGGYGHEGTCGAEIEATDVQRIDLGRDGCR